MVLAAVLVLATVLDEVAEALCIVPSVLGGTIQWIHVLNYIATAVYIVSYRHKML